MKISFGETYLEKGLQRECLCLISLKTKTSKITESLKRFNVSKRTIKYMTWVEHALVTHSTAIRGSSKSARPLRLLRAAIPVIRNVLLRKMSEA